MSTALVYEPRTLPSVDGRAYASRRLDLLRRQPYRAAVPARIADLTLGLPEPVSAAADDATAALVRFDSSTRAFLAPFTAILLRTESASSSQIENLTAGPRAVAEALIGERVEGNAPLIVSNVRAMEAALDLADSISTEAIIAMHDALLRDTAPGMVGGFRREQVWIGGPLPQSASFVPPHHDRVDEAMADLIRFAQRTDLPVLAQAAIAHAQFETIHPFPDGNGRTGRALVHAMLRHGGVLRHLAVPVSAGLLTDVGRYFSALDAYREGDVAEIVGVFAAASLEAVGNASALSDEIAASSDDWAERLRGVRSDSVARRLAALSIEYPVLNVAAAERLTGASRPAVTNGLDVLAERGIVTLGNSKKRNRIWVNQAVIDALTAFADRAGRRRSLT
jgi:Fic family protein